jgi:hypothetical protein
MSQIHWLNAVNGSFTNAADWSGGAVPSASDDAILDAPGSSFTVSSGGSQTVESVQLISNATLSLTGGTFTARKGTGAGANAGVILVGAGAAFDVGGTVSNSGTIMLDGSNGLPGEAALSIVTLTATLIGGGEVVLGGSVNDTIGPLHSNANLYIVNNTISGAGTIGNKLFLFNYVDGVIDASYDTPLVIKGTISNNAGLVEATGAGGLIFKTAFLGNTSTGIVMAGAGSQVKLVNSEISGGTFTSSSAGTILAQGCSFESQNNPTVFDTDIKLLAQTDIVGTISNYGTAVMSNHAAIGVVGAWTLEGGGTIDLNDGQISAVVQSASLTMNSGTIRGSGTITGSSRYALFVDIGAFAVIEQVGSDVLTISTPASLVNAGLIESGGNGGIVVEDSLVNSGTLDVRGGGTFVVDGAVTGKGGVIISDGVLEFISTFNEHVSFSGGGTLTLAESQKYKNTIQGFSNVGSTTLNLLDIGFVASSEATFSGSSAGGVLMVTDGVHTANIALEGNYLGVTFIASGDGVGGTEVVAQMAGGPNQVHAMASAMAALGVNPAMPSHLAEHAPAFASVLSAPRICAS